MGPLVAAGAIVVHADRARALEAAVEALCGAAGLSQTDEFKWSPPRGSAMAEQLTGEPRERFQLAVVDTLAEYGAVAYFVAEDAERGRAIEASTSPEDDVIRLLLERLASRLKEVGDSALLIADRPGGGRKEENQFLADCLDRLREGTQWVKHDEITFVVSTQSRFVRLLQAADLVTSCLTAYVGGEATHSPSIAERLLSILPHSLGVRGGRSVKLHPYYNFVNLYHWLLGDSNDGYFQGSNVLPLANRPYATDPMVP